MSDLLRTERCRCCSGKGTVERLNAAAFRRRRKKLGLSLRTVATRAGVSHVYLSDLELGKRNASAKSAAKLIRAVIS